jgi:hypothetical protein
MIPLFGRVPGRASGPSRSQVDNGGGLQYVSWKDVRALRVFTMKGIYRRKGGVRGGLSGPHHRSARPGGRPRHPHCAAASWLSSVSPLDSVFVSGK